MKFNQRMSRQIQQTCHQICSICSSSSTTKLREHSR